MEVIKLPDCIDPVKIIRKTALKRDLVCPFCGNKREVNDEIINGLPFFDRGSIYFIRCQWTGQKNGKPYLFRWGKKIRKWEENVCECKKCGGKWEGDPYPVDIIGG